MSTGSSTGAQNFAYGDALTALEASAADPEHDGAGDYTFYGRLATVNGSGADHPAGLPTTWMGRFANGGAFSAGTASLVWRGAWPMVPFACASPPPELDQAQLLTFDEEKKPFSMATAGVFGLAAQRVELADPSRSPCSYTSATSTTTSSGNSRAARSASSVRRWSSSRLQRRRSLLGRLRRVGRWTP